MFKGIKGCKLNHFRFWNIKKWLNEKNKQVKTHGPWGKARQEYMSLEVEKWPLWSRKKARKHGKWGIKQDSTAWKFRTQNLVVTYTLTLRTNFENLLESILDIIYIVSNLGKSEVQHFKRCANQSWNEEVMVMWRQLHKVEGPFQN